MKIIKDESVYEDGVNFHCIYFDDGTYVCFTENEYHDLLKIIENGNQSDLNNLINSTPAKNSPNTSGGDLSNIGMLFAIILGIVAIWMFNKTFQWIPIIISSLFFIMGLLSLINGFTNHRKFHIIYALIYTIGGILGYFLAMSCLFILISFSHVYLDSVQLSKIIKESGLDVTAGISLILTIIGTFFMGAYYDL